MWRKKISVHFFCVLYFQVIANMNAAYKQEKKKNAKRRTQTMASVTFKIADPLLSERDSPSPKKLKEGLYLSLPVETVLATEQGSAEDMKTELAYHLAESDDQWQQDKRSKEDTSVETNWKHVVMSCLRTLDGGD